MTVQRKNDSRSGTVLPMLAGSLIALLSFVGLAVDLGMLAVARTDCQNAADAAALAGARQLNNKPGVSDSNRSVALATAAAAVPVNKDIGASFTSAQVQSVTAGQYLYDTNSASPTYQTFVASYPSSISTGQSWTAMQVILNTAQPTFFMKIWGITSMPTGAVAVAVHRPRDLAMVLDMTGSMGYGSIVRMDDKVGGVGQGLNDPNTMWPQFAHYQRYTNYNTNNMTGSETGTLASRPNPFQQMGTATNGGYVYAPANLTIETYNGPAIVRDFFYDPSNLSNPTTAVTSTDGTTFKNAFHQWSPSESGADPTNLIGPTYDFTNYNAMDTTGTTGALPAPTNFETQLDSPVAYVGDKFPRKAGLVVTTTATTWDPTNASGAAVNVAEYLGWVQKYSSGTTLPGISASGTYTSGSYVARTFTGRTAANFFDRTWETYGYDMDVADYIANRGSTWDPRGSGSTSAAGVALPTNTTGGKSGQVKVTPGKFVGYSMGPGYFGKTFMIWPPDPRTPVADPGQTGYVPGDWRVRYFFNRSGGKFSSQADNDSTTTGTQNINQELFTNGTGDTFTAQSGNWSTNYAEILLWLKSGPMVLPPNLRSGHVVYYTSIPSTVTASGSDSSAVAADKVFWKSYIDYVLLSTADRPSAEGPLAGPEPKGWPEGVTPSIAATSQYVSADPFPYMNYFDNPSRPRLHGWFGPITMMMFLHDYTTWSGTTHEAQCWQLKAGISSAIDEIRNNHPNDNCGMAFFTYGEYKSTLVPIGQDYTTLKNSLFFPQTLLPTLWNNTTQTGDNTAEFRPYNTSGLSSSMTFSPGNIPNAQNSTDPVTGVALAYNLLSPAPSLNTDATRLGRRGASKVVIFETDGIPNAIQGFTLNKAGYNSYYSYSSSGNNSSATTAQATTAATTVVSQIIAPVSSASTAGTTSGFSLPNAPARVYAIGFGDIFSTSSATAAESFLLSIQKAGNTSASTDTSIPSYQIITGTYQTRISNLQNGLQRILQGGVQVSLIE